MSNTRGLLTLSHAKLRAEEFLRRYPRTCESLGKAFALADSSPIAATRERNLAGIESFLAARLFPKEPAR